MDSPSFCLAPNRLPARNPVKAAQPVWRCSSGGKDVPRLSRREALRIASLVSMSVAIPAGAVSAPGRADREAALAPSLRSRTVAEQALRQSVLYEEASGSLLPVSALANVIQKTDNKCYLIGETHDELESHCAQLAALETIHRQDPGRPLVLGMEMFQRQHNAILQNYVSGNVSLQTMLTKAKWDENWGFPVALYQPIFEYCRSHRIPMVGLNCPEQLTRFVSQVGLQVMEENFPTLRSLLPETIDVTNLTHRNHFLRIMGFTPGVSDSAHADVSQSSSRVDRWYQAQCCWDEVMAESLSNVLNSQGPSAKVVALVGSGHMETRTAIPDRVLRRTGTRPYSIVTRPVGWTRSGGVPMPDIDVPERGADLVWYTSRKQDLV